VLGEKPVTVPLCPPNNLTNLTEINVHHMQVYSWILTVKTA